MPADVAGQVLGRGLERASEGALTELRREIGFIFQDHHLFDALTPRETLAASVDDQGTVRPGSRGDLVLLDGDPVDGSGSSLEQADRLRDMHVHATWVAGQLVYAEP